MRMWTPSGRSYAKNCADTVMSKHKILSSNFSRGMADQEANETMAQPDLVKGANHENRRRVPLRLHQGRRRRGPGEDYGLPLHGLPSRQWLRLPCQCSRSGCDLSHNGPAGDIPQDHGRERQFTPAGVLSALRLTDLFDLAGGGAAGVLHGTGGNLAPAP